MDYEKKYKEALERARQIQNTPYTAHWDVMKEVVEAVFPELKESEDERIRKDLMWAINRDWFMNGNTIKGSKFTKKDILAWLEKQGEQKPVEWSEEDETARNDIIAKLAILKSRAVDGGAEKEICEMEINWLNSIKERVQPKQEWSEDDKKCLKELTQFFENLLDCIATEERHKENRRWLNWLKSLRPQSHWRPSKEQMNVLNEVINFAADHGTMRWNDYIYNVLKSLREQLKEL